MKIIKIVVSLLVAGSFLVLSLSCSKSSATATTAIKTTAVQRGDISVYITGTGNLAYSKTEDMAFEMAGYVEEVLVNKGDTVSKGDEIARLNTTDWEDDIKTHTDTLTKVQRALITARSSVTRKERNQVSAGIAVTRAQRTVTEKELLVGQAQLSLRSAEYSLSQMAIVIEAQETVDIARNLLDVAQQMHDAGDLSNTQAYLDNLKKDYNNDLAYLENIKSGKDPSLTPSTALQIARYRLAIDKAVQDVEDAQIAVENAKKDVTEAQLDEKDAQKAVNNARLDLADSEQDVQDAQSNLDEIKALSPVIKAPFDGFISDIKVSGGDEVQKGSVAAVISDPEQFEANILVTENDIFSVKVGEEATVSLDALSGIAFPAKITFISPTAKISSGVVNYSVTVQVTSLKPVNTLTAQQAQFPSGAGPSGAIPSGTPRAGFNRPSGTFSAGTRPSGTPPSLPSGSLTGVPQGRAFGGSGSGARSTTTSVTLKQGLTATVKIVSEQASNVLLVPSRAITTRGKTKTVQVVEGTSSSAHEVTVGMSDGTNTEISAGVSEGEEVTYKVNISSSTASTGRNQPSMGLGLGRQQIRVR